MIDWSKLICAKVELLTRRQISSTDPLANFGESRPRLLIVLTGYSLSAALFGAIAPFGLNRFASVILGLAALLFGYLAWRAAIRFMRAFSEQNWIMRITEDALLLRIRAFTLQNDDDDPIFVKLKYGEIGSVNACVETRLITDDRGWVELTFLEIALAHHDTAEVKLALYREKIAAPADARFCVPHTNQIRISFRAEDFTIRPGIDGALTLLAPHCKILEKRHVRRQSWTELPSPEAQKYAEMLYDEGDYYGAMNVLAERNCGSRGEAGIYLRERHRFLAAYCKTCGYDLRGSSDCCPECGKHNIAPELPASSAV